MVAMHRYRLRGPHSEHHLRSSRRQWSSGAPARTAMLWPMADETRLAFVACLGPLSETCENPANRVDDDRAMATVLLRITQD